MTRSDLTTKNMLYRLISSELAHKSSQTLSDLDIYVSTTGSARNDGYSPAIIRQG